MTSIPKNMYIDLSYDLVNKYNNTYRSTIKIKSVDVKSNTYIDFDKKNNKGDPRFKLVDNIRISKYKNTFEKGYVPNCSEDVFEIKKVESTVPRTYIKILCHGLIISDLNGEEVVSIFYEKGIAKS